MRLTFQARQTRFHSPVALRNPRKENCLNPITDLMMPKTGSTVCLRMAQAALPAVVGQPGPGDGATDFHPVAVAAPRAARYSDWLLDFQSWT